ncbi:hypothetical protein A9G35_04720 [Gilliamella sp. Choc5-1]|nr:hypothetical protein A9G35_04720 [Gilliamella apicola]
MGDTLYECQYNAYGQIINETYHQDDFQTLPDNPLRFQGQYYDEETGLHYNLNRYYDPFTGRYITQDPIKLFAGFNNYCYVNNDVSNIVDPLGLCNLPLMKDLPKADELAQSERITLTKDYILTKIDGVTPQASRIVRKIENGELRLNVLGDELFNRYFDKDAVAMAIKDNIYVRKSSPSLYSDIIHEGTHALDYSNKFGKSSLISMRIWETRAFAQERAFQLRSGSPLEFSTVKMMLKHIEKNYPNIKYNPYKN